MTHTLILIFHPDLAGSRANAALGHAATRLPGVDAVDLHALYPDGVIDADAEVARLLSADRIVLQFPLQWYSTPPLLKAWQDLVLTRMFYIHYEAEGRKLEGKPLLVAVTAGNTSQAYGPGGRNLYPLPELLKPLEVTANRCGLPWAAPFIVFEAGQLSPEALAVQAALYVERLKDWMAPAKPPRPMSPARAPEPRRGLPMALPAAAMALPLLVLAHWLLAGEAAAAEGWSWAGTVAAVLIIPLVWIMLAALRLARPGRRMAGAAA